MRGPVTMQARDGNTAWDRLVNTNKQEPELTSGSCLLVFRAQSPSRTAAAKCSEPLTGVSNAGVGKKQFSKLHVRSKRNLLKGSEMSETFDPLRLKPFQMSFS